MDEARFSGEKGEKNVMKMATVYEGALRRNGSENGILSESEIKSKCFPIIETGRLFLI